MKLSAPHQISAFSVSLPSWGVQAELPATKTGFQHILLQDKSRALDWQGAIYDCYKIK